MTTSLVRQESRVETDRRDQRRHHLLTRLRDELADDEIAVRDVDLAVVPNDLSPSRWSGRPVAVVRPWTVAGVAATLRVASATGTTVVPRGVAAQSYGEAASPDGTIVLSTERLNRFLTIDPDTRLAVVQAGVAVDDLEAAAVAADLTLVRDPVGAHPTTIGGAIAGARSLWPTGASRASVLGLTVVLGDGSVLPVGRHATGPGPDLTGLFVGSGGTLGVIVEATLQLRPRRVETRTLAAWFPSTAAAATGAQAALARGITPSLLELDDAGTLRAIDESQGTELAEYGSALLLVETEGPGADAEIATLTGTLVDLGADVDLPGKDEARQYRELLQHGRDRDQRRWLVDEDIAVPRSSIGPLLERLERIGAVHAVSTSVVADAAGGAVHPSFTVPRRPGETGPPPALQEAVDDAVRAAAELGAAGSGRPGSPPPATGAAPAADLQRRLRSVFDPAGVLPHRPARPTKENPWPAS